MKTAFLSLFLFFAILANASAQPVCYWLWKGEEKPAKFSDQLCMNAGREANTFVFEIRNLKRNNWETVANLTLQRLRVIGCPACNYVLFGIKSDGSALTESVQVEFRGTYNFQDKSEEGKVFVFGSEYNYHSI